jgi:hypothetical protein
MPVLEWVQVPKIPMAWTEAETSSCRTGVRTDVTPPKRYPEEIDESAVGEKSLFGNRIRQLIFAFKHW